MVGDLIGAAIAVVIITLVRGLADRSEREAAEGGDLPMIGTDGPRPSRGTKEPADGVA